VFDTGGDTRGVEVQPQLVLVHAVEGDVFHVHLGLTAAVYYMYIHILYIYIYIYIYIYRYIYIYHVCVCPRPHRRRRCLRRTPRGGGAVAHIENSLFRKAH